MCIPWKKQDSPSFDVIMGSYDRAEICELVGLYILDKIVSCNIGIKRHEFGLYRDEKMLHHQCMYTGNSTIPLQSQRISQL